MFRNICVEIFGNPPQYWIEILGQMQCHRFSPLAASSFVSQSDKNLWASLKNLNIDSDIWTFLKNQNRFRNVWGIFSLFCEYFFRKYLFLKYFNASSVVSAWDQFHHLKMGNLFLHQFEIWKKVCWKFSRNLSPKLFNWRYCERNYCVKTWRRNWKKIRGFDPTEPSPHFSRLPNGNGIWNLLPRNTFESYLAGKSFWFLVWRRTIMFRESP